MQLAAAPRQLSAEQRDAIASRLRAFSPQFDFASYQDDQEVRGLVVALVEVLHGAGWKGLPASEMLFGGLVVGVVVEYTPAREKDFGLPARALVEALNAQGITASVSVTEEMNRLPDRIRVSVGRKPAR